MNCKNCEAKVEENFCPKCGQKSDTHRITFKHLFHEFAHAITHADKGFLLLIRELLVRPGFVVREYVEGKRKKYFNPINFLVITAALEAYITYKTGYYEALSYSNSSSQQRHPIHEEMMNIMINNGKLLNLILIVPLLSLMTRIFFRKSGYNYSENLTLHAYVNGMINLSNVVIFVPLYLLFSSQVNYINILFQSIFLIYLVISYKQFFRNSLFLTIIKSILIMISFIVLYWICLFLFVIAKHIIF